MFLLISLALSFTFSLDNIENTKKEIRNPDLNIAWQKSIGILESAKNASFSQNTKNTYHAKALRILKNVRFHYPEPNYTYKDCNENTAAFTHVRKNAFANKYYTKNSIYLCKHPSEYRIDTLSQILIHEAFHRIGIIDHCVTTSMEIDTYYKANEIVAKINPHYLTCNAFIPKLIRPGIEALFAYKSDMQFLDCLKSKNCKLGEDIEIYKNLIIF